MTYILQSPYDTKDVKSAALAFREFGGLLGVA